jgi:hypothetical protein
MTIIVSSCGTRLKGVNESEMKLATVYLARRALVDAVEIVPGQLVCDEQTQQSRAAPTREDRK